MSQEDNRSLPEEPEEVRVLCEQEDAKVRVRVETVDSPTYCFGIEAYEGIKRPSGPYCYCEDWGQGPPPCWRACEETGLNDYLLIGGEGKFKFYKEQADGCLQPMEIDGWRVCRSAQKFSMPDCVFFNTLGTYFIPAGDEVPAAFGPLLSLDEFGKEMLKEMLEAGELERD